MGEFQVTLNADALRDKLRDDPNFRLSLWVIGQDTSGDMARSSSELAGAQYISIRVIKQASVQVTQLKDIPLSNQNKVGNYYQSEMSFCVYVSQSPYEYAISIADMNTGGAGTLRLESSNGQNLSYEMAFANYLSGLNDGAYKNSASSMSYLGPFLGSMDLNCADGHSAAIGIRVPSLEADSKPDGVYKDTITVYVEPY